MLIKPIASNFNLHQLTLTPSGYNCKTSANKSVKILLAYMTSLTVAYNLFLSNVCSITNLTFPPCPPSAHTLLVFQEVDTFHQQHHLANAAIVI